MLSKNAKKHFRLPLFEKVLNYSKVKIRGIGNGIIDCLFTLTTLTGCSLVPKSSDS